MTGLKKNMISTISLFITGSSTVNCTDSISLKKTTHYHKYDSVNMDNSRVNRIKLQNVLKYSAILKKNHPSIDYNITSFAGVSF